MKIKFFSLASIVLIFIISSCSYGPANSTSDSALNPESKTALYDPVLESDSIDVSDNNGQTYSSLSSEELNELFRQLDILAKGTPGLQLSSEYIWYTPKECLNIGIMDDFLNAYNIEKDTSVIIPSIGNPAPKIYHLQYLEHSDECILFHYFIGNQTPIRTNKISRIDKEETGYIFYDDSAEPVLLLYKDGWEEGPKNLCSHEEWEHAIDQRLINYVGQKEFSDWKKTTVSITECKNNIYAFLSYFQIDYETIRGLLDVDADDIYDMEKIKDYLKENEKN